MFNQMDGQNQQSQQSQQGNPNRGQGTFGAHEIIGMNEALMAKAANCEMLHMLSQRNYDQDLSSMLERQAHESYHHYLRGVSLLQGQQSQTLNQDQMGTAQSMQHVLQQQPKIGLRHPFMPAPNMQSDDLSERTVGTIVLNMHKFGTVSWVQYALECTHPEFRSYLMEGAMMCDKMAYETWSYLNQKGYYQVAQLADRTMQTMMNSFQTDSQIYTQNGSMPM